MHASKIKGQIDFGIITGREDEFEAVLERFPKRDVAIGRRRYNLSEVETVNGDSYRTATIRIIEEGNGEAMDAARDLLEELEPQWLLVVGTGSGVPSDEISLGDVALSTRIHDFSVEAVLTAETREYALAGGPIHKAAAIVAADLPAMSAELGDWNSPASIGEPRPGVTLEDGSFYGSDDWTTMVRESLERRFHRHPARSPLVKAGPIASSDRIIKDTELAKVWLRIARSIVALEMASAGIYRAASGRGVPALSIRGISNIIGFTCDPRWTTYACHSAAAFTRAFLRVRPIEPRNARPSIAVPVKAASPRGERAPGGEPSVATSPARPATLAASAEVHAPRVTKRGTLIMEATAVGAQPPAAQPVEAPHATAARIEAPHATAARVGDREVPSNEPEISGTPPPVVASLSAAEGKGPARPARPSIHFDARRTSPSWETPKPFTVPLQDAPSAPAMRVDHLISSPPLQDTCSPAAQGSALREQEDSPKPPLTPSLSSPSRHEPTARRPLARLYAASAAVLLCICASAGAYWFTNKRGQAIVANSIGVGVRNITSSTPVPVPTPAPTPPRESEPSIPFDEEAANQALTFAVRQTNKQCKKPDGPTGSGLVNVTFDITGQVIDVVLLGGPFTRTSAEPCILRVFQAAKVPAFSGSPVTKSRSFSILK